MYLQEKQKKKICIRKELILSGGVFQTPKYLSLIGIGPKNTLEQLNIIPQVINEYVGTSLCYQIVLHIISNFSGENDQEFALSYFDSHITRGAQVGNKSEAQLLFNSFGLIYMGQMKSVGYVKLASTNSSVPPIIAYNLFTDQPNPNDSDDLARLIYSFRTYRNILNNPAYSNYYHGEISPGSTVSSNNVTQIIDFLKANLLIGHPHGSNHYAVTPKLLVKGVKNIRIIDGSVTPPNAINSPDSSVCMMIAIRAARIIYESLF